MKIILQSLLRRQYISVSSEDNRVCTRDQISSNEIFTLIKNTNGTVSLMTSHGHFLGSMDDGTIYTTNHIKDWEMWTMIKNKKEGVIYFKDAHQQYLSCSENDNEVYTSSEFGLAQQFMCHMF
jgi:hypothetical protein